ncbi:MAG: non-canonical purine NTP pyrophosphatase, partial [Planctomycetia bacterium]|nr:non-canonical purine NTP pyrophosphatase [Planctomycetia bacterium]
NDARNIETLLEALGPYPRDSWHARYVCVIALASAKKVLLTTRGTCRGIITPEARGTGGFGYDPCFFVPSLGKTMAEMAPEVKNRISHRGRALRAFKEKLKALL